MKEEQACVNPFEDQRKQALEHYRDISSQCNHWSGFVEQAIKEYRPNEKHSPIEPEGLPDTPLKDEFIGQLKAKTVTREMLYRVVLEKVYKEEIRTWQMMDKVNKESGMGPVKKSSMLQLIENVLENNPQPDTPLQPKDEGAIELMSKSIKCLALELSEPVWEDVSANWQAVLNSLPSGSDAVDWKQKFEQMEKRCEAAEEVIECLPDRPENLYELGFHQALKQWQDLKTKTYE